MSKKKSIPRKDISSKNPDAGRTYRKSKKITFYGLLLQNMPKSSATTSNLIDRSSPLAHLDYEVELELKNKSLKQFWQHHNLEGEPEPIIASPRPRHYRTTSKRKTSYKGSKFSLLIADKKNPTKKRFAESPLEPPAHTALYRFLLKKISDPSYRVVASHLNFLIIRGNYKETSLIFNVDTLNGPLVRKLKILTGLLQKEKNPVTGVYIYPDPTGSDYYLEDRRPANLIHFKKLYGPPYLKLSQGKARYHYHPTSFSQINESIVPLMLKKTQELLKPASGGVLLDLYCGYGLFSHYLAPKYKQVIGIDSEGPSIRSAISNKKLNTGSKNSRFLSHNITGKVLEEVLPPSLGHKESIILDPPRQGPQHEVISTLASRRPDKVLHVHCGVEQIPISIREWQRNGYAVKNIVPLDMFPGSANLEVIIYLIPKQSTR